MAVNDEALLLLLVLAQGRQHVLLEAWGGGGREGRMRQSLMALLVATDSARTGQGRGREGGRGGENDAKEREETDIVPGRRE